jgi:hypothetical protein
MSTIPTMRGIVLKGQLTICESIEGIVRSEGMRKLGMEAIGRWISGSTVGWEAVKWVPVGERERE